MLQLTHQQPKYPFQVRQWRWRCDATHLAIQLGNRCSKWSWCLIRDFGIRLKDLKVKYLKIEIRRTTNFEIFFYKKRFKQRLKRVEFVCWFRHSKFKKQSLCANDVIWFFLLRHTELYWHHKNRLLLRGHGYFEIFPESLKNQLSNLL